MHTTREVTIPSDYALSGTLTIPNDSSKKLPAILIIGGAGSADREGNVGYFKSNILRSLSEIFTENGYITLRYDKRGVGKSAGNYYEAGLSDFLNDAISAVRYLKTIAEVDANHILVAGHSEGAFLAPAVYEQEQINGLILLCGTASPGREIMSLPGKKLIEEIQQTTGLKGVLFKIFRLDKVAKKFWESINRKALASEHPVVKIFGFKKFNAKWLRESYEFDVRDYLKKIKCPTLVIGGEKDIQADPADAEKIAALILGPVVAQVIPNMNHILCHYEGRHHLLTCMREYKKSLKNGISSDLFKVISNWLSKKKETPAPLPDNKKSLPVS